MHQTVPTAHGGPDPHIARNEQRIQAPTSDLIDPYLNTDSLQTSYYSQVLSIYLTSKSMQRNKLLRLEANIGNSEISDSESTDSEITVKANPETDPQYLYYRLFTNDIGITSQQPAFVDNPYLGRIKRHSVAPPWAVLQLKRRLCGAESTEFASSTLYLSASNQSPMDDGDRMPDTLGSTMDNPAELVVMIQHWYMEQRTLKAYPQAQYIYYCLYSEDGVMEPKHALKTNADCFPSIARIDKNLIPPRHNLDAVIRCISYVEGFPNCVWHQLFPDIVSELPIDDLDVWGMQPGCSGSLSERPLVFVKSAAMKQYINPIKNPTKLYCPGSETVNIYGNQKLYTDGVVRREVLSDSGIKFSVYRAFTAEGERGLIQTNAVESLSN